MLASVLSTVSALVCASVCVPAQALDLVQSYLAARDHDSILASARAAHEGSAEILRQARAQLGPTLAGNASAGLLQTHLLGFPPSSGATEQGALTLDQPLFHRADWAALDEGHSQVRRADAQLAQAEQDLVLRVAQAYLSVLLAQDLLTATQREKESIALQLAQAKRSYEVGTVTITDVTDAQARYDVILATEVQSQGDLEVARRALELLTGLTVDSLAGISVGAASRLPEPNDLQYWIRSAQERSPVVEQAAATFDAQQQEVDRARAAWYPTLDLVGSVSKQNFSHSDLNVQGTGGKTAEIGLQISYTFFDSGSRGSKVRQAVAVAEQSRSDLQTSRNAATQGTRQAFIGVSSAVAQVQALTRAASSGRISLEGALRGKEAGTRTAVDVLNARQLWFQTLRQLATARYSAILDMLQLKAAAGGLSARDLDGLTSASAGSALFAPGEELPR
jgi:outer membrane protein